MHIQDKVCIDHYLDHNSHPKAGIILLTSDNKVLILKGTSGKWSFPKGGKEFICQHCRNILKNPLDFNLKCPQHPSGGFHKMVSETIRQCAERELREETGISLPKKYEVISYHTVMGTYEKPGGGCIYLIIKSNKKKSKIETEINIDTREIVSYKWIKIRELAEKAKKEYYSYNMGIRKMLSYLVLIDLYFRSSIKIHDFSFKFMESLCSYKKQHDLRDSS